MIGALAPLPSGPSSRPQKNRGGRGPPSARAAPGPDGGTRAADAWVAADAAADAGRDMAIVLHGPEAGGGGGGGGGGGERQLESRLSTESASRPLFLPA